MEESPNKGPGGGKSKQRTDGGKSKNRDERKVSG